MIETIFTAILFIVGICTTISVVLFWRIASKEEAITKHINTPYGPNLDHPSPGHLAACSEPQIILVLPQVEAQYREVRQHRAQRYCPA